MGSGCKALNALKELIGDHGALLEDFSRLILKVDWETTLALTQRVWYETYGSIRSIIR